MKLEFSRQTQTKGFNT